MAKTAEALKPWYNQFCKRPCFHDQYLDTFNRPNVHLVDTQGQGVERITPRGVVVAGKEYPLDCLIFGTGFEVGTDFTRRLGFEVTGRNGLTLTQKWKDGASTFHGVQSQLGEVIAWRNAFWALSDAMARGVRVVRATRCARGRVIPDTANPMPDSAGLPPVKARLALALSLLEP